MIKKIRTLMTSANRYNVIGLEKMNASVKNCYSYGEGYAWMWIDYGSLSKENRKLVQSWYRQDTEIDPQKEDFYVRLVTIPNRGTLTHS